MFLFYHFTDKFWVSNHCDRLFYSSIWFIEFFYYYNTEFNEHGQSQQFGSQKWHRTKDSAFGNETAAFADNQTVAQRHRRWIRFPIATNLCAERNIRRTLIGHSAKGAAQQCERSETQRSQTTRTKCTLWETKHRFREHSDFVERESARKGHIEWRTYHRTEDSGTPRKTSKCSSLKQWFIRFSHTDFEQTKKSWRRNLSSQKRTHQRAKAKQYEHQSGRTKEISCCQFPRTIKLQWQNTFSFKQFSFEKRTEGKIKEQRKQRKLRK